MRNPLVSCPQGLAWQFSDTAHAPHFAGPLHSLFPILSWHRLGGFLRKDRVSPYSLTVTTTQTAASYQAQSPLPIPPRLHPAPLRDTTPGQLRQPFVPGRLVWSPLLAL